MTELFSQILNWVGAHPVWSGMVIFLVAMAESVAIIGLIVPGVVIMFGIGALIAADAIALHAAIGWAVAGAVAGDGLSFLVGYRYREELTRLWPFSRYPQSLDQGILFFDRYGGKSVAFGRFFGPVRAVIPLVAGMMGMHPGRFAVANVLSAVAWAPAYLLPGMLFGASLELASEVAFRLVALIILLALMLLLSTWLARRVFLFIHPHASFLVQKILEWGQLHPKMGEIAAALADPAHPEAKGLSILASLLVFTIGVFTLLMGTILESTALAGVDHAILNGLQSLRTPWVDHLMVSFTQLMDLTPFLVFSVAMLGLFALKGHKRTAQHWAAGILFCLIASPLLKLGLQVPRPEIVTSLPDSFSFPSGHVLRAVVAYGFLAVITARTVPVRYRWIPYGVAVILSTAVALSRLYLGVHWLSDVLGSVTLGLAWVAALGLAYQRHTRIGPGWGGIALATAVLLLAVPTTYGLVTHDQAIARYMPAREVSKMAETDWVRARWRDQPAFRQDTRELGNHPINVQFAGSLDELADSLESDGWQRATAFRWGDLVRYLAPGVALQELPILPQVHDGRHESLILLRNTSEGDRFVLRLWATDVSIDPGGRPLWIGNVTEQTLESATQFITYAATMDETSGALEALLSSTRRTAVHRGEGSRGVVLLRGVAGSEPGDVLTRPQDAPHRDPS